MKTLLITCLLTVSLHAASWTELSNTTMHTVCPANNGDGSSTTNYTNYAFNSLCKYVIFSWGGAALDTTRTHMILWGGGQGEYKGNEVYQLDLSGTPAVSRLTNPSVFATSGCPEVQASDGYPVSRHTYQGLTYIASSDVVIAFSGRTSPCDGGTNSLYALDLSVTPPVWTSKDPTSGTALTSLTTSLGGAQCVKDASDNLYCNIPGGSYNFFKYVYSTNTATVLNGSSTAIPFYSSGVWDPDHSKVVYFGNANSSTPHVVTATTTGTIADITGTTTGCDTLAAAYYPGLTWDSLRHLIVGYVGTGFSAYSNAVYTFSLDTLTCSLVSASGGGPPTPAGLAGNAGTFNRFTYVSTRDSFVVIPTMLDNAWELSLSGGSKSAGTSSTGGKSSVN